MYDAYKKVGLLVPDDEEAKEEHEEETLLQTRFFSDIRFTSLLRLEIMVSALTTQVAACNKRARDRGLAGVLSTLDWQRTLTFFKERCAYCGDAALTIDHFHPMALGGPTSYSNCVPSCVSCNERKGAQPPDHLLPSFSSPDVLLRIRTYLEEIGMRHHASWTALCAREPLFAYRDTSTMVLKHSCEEYARSSAPYNSSYAWLRLMLFGVPWDPAYYFQVRRSLEWHHHHSTDLDLTAACENLQHLVRQREALSPGKDQTHEY